MPFGDAAHQLEGAKGVVALAAELPQHWAALLFGDFCEGLCAGALGPAVGVNEKYRLSLGQVLSGEGQDALVELPKIDPGGKADAVILLQPNGLAGSYIDEIYLTLFGHGLQNFQGVPMVAGIVADSGFHSFLPP